MLLDLGYFRPGSVGICRNLRLLRGTNQLILSPSILTFSFLNFSFSVLYFVILLKEINVRLLIEDA